MAREAPQAGSLSLSVAVSRSLSLSLSLSLPRSRSLSLSLSVFRALSLSRSLSLFPSFCMCVCGAVCLVCLCPSIAISGFPDGCWMLESSPELQTRTTHLRPPFKRELQHYNGFTGRSNDNKVLHDKFAASRVRMSPTFTLASCM